MKSYYIYFYRNGLTDSNLEGKYIGHTDVELSEDGVKQIEQMKKDYDYPYVEAVFTSPLKRCTKTANLVYPDKEAIVINDLIEYNFGEYEGRTAEELKENELFSRWLSGEQGVEPPFGESNEAFANRVANCFIKIVDGLLKTGTTKAAIFTHGGVIMYLLSAFGIPEAPMHEWLMPGGCGYAIRITPGIWSRGRKFEVIAEVPYVPGEDEEITE
ncbi:MAG: histidine phosphatase family protein [Ruminococcaceae bacterium]|nr:histidine phosphatase family protein [Oscillospiraceae bacterium]